MNEKETAKLYEATRAMTARVTSQVFEVFRDELAKNDIEINPISSMVTEEGRLDANRFQAPPGVLDVVRVIFEHDSDLLIAATSVETLDSWDEVTPQKKAALTNKRIEAVRNLLSPKEEAR